MPPGPALPSAAAGKERGPGLPPSHPQGPAHLPAAGHTSPTLMADERQGHSQSGASSPTTDKGLGWLSTALTHQHGLRQLPRPRTSSWRRVVTQGLRHQKDPGRERNKNSDMAGSSPDLDITTASDGCTISSSPWRLQSHLSPQYRSHLEFFLISLPLTLPFPLLHHTPVRHGHAHLGAP